jgi:hypothetical protein
MFALMSGWVDGLLCNGGWAGGRVERRGRNRLHALFSSSEEASRGDFPITLLRFRLPVHRVCSTHTPRPCSHHGISESLLTMVITHAAKTASRAWGMVHPQKKPLCNVYARGAKPLHLSQKKTSQMMMCPALTCLTPCRQSPVRQAQCIRHHQSLCRVPDSPTSWQAPAQLRSSRTCRA